MGLDRQKPSNISPGPAISLQMKSEIHISGRTERSKKGKECTKADKPTKNKTQKPTEDKVSL